MQKIEKTMPAIAIASYRDAAAVRAKHSRKKRQLGGIVIRFPSAGCRFNDVMHAEWYFEAGLDATEFGDNNAAMACFFNALRHDRESASAAITWFNIGIIRKSRGRYKAAEKAYRAALKISPRYSEVYYYLANLLADHGDLANAIYYYHKALATSPNHNDARFDLASTYVKIAEYSLALKHYKQYLHSGGPKTAEVEKEMKKLEKHELRIVRKSQHDHVTLTDQDENVEITRQDMQRVVPLVAQIDQAS